MGLVHRVGALALLESLAFRGGGILLAVRCRPILYRLPSLFRPGGFGADFFSGGQKEGVLGRGSGGARGAGGGSEKTERVEHAGWKPQGGGGGGAGRHRVLVKMLGVFLFRLYGLCMIRGWAFGLVSERFLCQCTSYVFGGAAI